MAANKLPDWAEPAEGTPTAKLPAWAEPADAPVQPTLPAPAMWDQPQGPAAPPPDAPGVVRTFLGHAADMGGVPGGPPNLGSLGPPQDAYEHDLEAGREANPYAAAMGDVTGFVASPEGAGAAKALGAAGKLAKFGKVAATAARGLAGAGVGALTSGVNTLAKTGDVGQAWDAAKSGAGLGGAAGVAPLLTGAGLVASGLRTDDPQERAQRIVGGAGLAIPGALSHMDILGKPLERVGETARSSVLGDLIKELLPQETKDVRASNAQGLAATKSRFRLLQKSTSPVGGGPGNGTPSIPGQPDLEAQALGKLGSKVQDNFRYLRSKDDLGLKLTPEAEQGAAAILPDYEAGANKSLGEFAGGKEAVLKSILESLRSPEAQPAAGPAKSTLADPYFPRPDLLPTSGTLKPSPTAGFTPEPLPTPESMGPKLAPEVNARLGQMRKDRGLTSRLGAGAVKGATGLLGQGGLLTDKPGAIAAGGVLGAGKALLNDPVLATSLVEPTGRALNWGASKTKAITDFLAGSTGPMLTAKLHYLMDNDPEFKAAMEAQNGR